MPEDWQLAPLRTGLGRETPTVFTVAGGQVVPALANRISIVVYPPAVDDIVVSFRSPVDLAAGCRIKAGSQPLVMTIDDYGPLVTRQLFGRTAGAANQNIGIVEVGNSN